MTEETTAELWLPVAKKTLAAADGEVSDQAPPKTLPPRVVLVVDDDSLVLTNMAAMLEDLGHKVFEANSALQRLPYFGGRPRSTL